MKNYLVNIKMSLTGVRDTDMLILLQLEDRELGPVCQVNSYVRSICNDQNFWKMRIVNRIKKAFDMNLKTGVKFNIIPVDAVGVENMKKFFGLTDMKKLNEFLKEMPENTLYFVYHDTRIGNTFDSLNISPLYKFEGLPLYINKQELIFNLRREILKRFYEYKNDSLMFFPEMPGYEYPTKKTFILPDNVYEMFKKMGFRT